MAALIIGPRQKANADAAAASAKKSPARRDALKQSDPTALEVDAMESGSRPPVGDAMGGRSAAIESPGDRSKAPAQKIWLDVDLAIGMNRPILGVPIPGLAADPDDAYALLMTLGSPELRLEGVSTVAGNSTNLQAMTESAKKALDRFGPARLKGRVYQGGAFDHRAAEQTPAVKALATALQNDKLTIVALGPLTNVAAMIRAHPELAGRIERVVLVGGTRPDRTIKLGRVTASDFNIAQDPDAAALLLERGVKLTLVPFELSSKLWMSKRDLDQMEGPEGTTGTRWLARGSRGWIRNWRWLFGEKRGFNPFDAVAIAVLLKPELFRSRTTSATASREGGLRVDVAGAQRTLEYYYDLASPEAAAEFKRLLHERIRNAV